MIKIIKCPIAVTLSHIGKKWSMTIIRDMTFGIKNFTDFLKTNPGLSSKVLAERLKNLESSGFIIRKKLSRSAVEYSLTPRGIKLKRVLYALSMFGAEEFTEEVFGVQHVDYDEIVKFFGRGFALEESELEMFLTPQIEQAYTRKIEIGTTAD